MAMKWVYRFEEVRAAERTAGSWDGVRALLGGKGANLAEMTRIGMPVPAGFTITTRACNTYLKRGNRFPPGMWTQVQAAMKAVERKTGKLAAQWDTARTFESINGIEGNGESVDNASIIAVNGLLLMNSGYGLFGQGAGNVMIAYKPRS